MLPRVKCDTKQGGRISFDNVKLFGEKNSLDFANNYLNLFLEKDLMNSDLSKTYDVLNIKLEKSSRCTDSAYTLIVEDEVVIFYFGNESLRNALSTIIQLIYCEDEKFFIERRIIEDCPDCKFRSVMIDLARGLPDRDRLFEDIKRLSLAKCNNITFHIMDSMGLCYESDLLPNDIKINETKLYTKQELKDVVSFCEQVGINAIAGIEIPAHASTVVEHHHALECRVEPEKKCTWTVCAGAEETYEFYSKLIDEVCSMFPSEYVHMGGDELYFNDFPEWNNFCRWEDCQTCRETMQKNNIPSMRELYYYLINRIYDILAAKNKKMIIYNDQLDLSKEVAINKNIIVQYWRVSNENRGPRKGCSMNSLAKQGFKVINSTCDICYLDLDSYANPEKSSYFSYKEYPETECKDNIIGCEICAWEYGNPCKTHYNLSFACSAALLLDKLWDTKNVCYDKTYRQSLTKFLLGYNTPVNYDMTELFGSVVPPRVNEIKKYSTIENELIGIETLTRHHDVISNIGYTYSDIYKKYVLDTLFYDM